jgi:hypothetical protein
LTIMYNSHHWPYMDVDWSANFFMDEITICQYALLERNLFHNYMLSWFFLGCNASYIYYKLSIGHKKKYITCQHCLQMPTCITNKRTSCKRIFYKHVQHNMSKFFINIVGQEQLSKAPWVANKMVLSCNQHMSIYINYNNNLIYDWT